MVLRVCVEELCVIFLDILVVLSIQFYLSVIHSVSILTDEEL